MREGRAVAGSSSVLSRYGDLPVGAAVLAAGHEPNGYLRERALQDLAGGLLTQAELDPEAGMSCVRGDPAVLCQLREELEEYLDAPRGSPGSSERRKPQASSSTTEHSLP